MSISPSPLSSLRQLPIFAPADHVRVLHPQGRRGIATVARGGKQWKEQAVPIADLAPYVADMAGKADLFLSQQSFYGWRRIAPLAQLGATYADLDYHRTAQWAGFPPEYVTEAVLRALDDACMPGPSYILSTGRGLLAVWLHSLVPRAALPRWMAMQKQLARILAFFGADPRALDAARVFRLAGTENSKAHAIVRPTYLAAAPAALWRWDFEDFTREVLPRERAVIVSLNARRAERVARDKGPAPTHILTAATYWETVLADLQRLRQARWFGPLPPGQRDTWLFLACTAMTWLAPAFTLRREFYALAKEAGGWREREVDSRMGAVFSRATAAAVGRSVEWGGKALDPRYRFQAGTIVEWLEISPAEMRDAGLRVLVDRDVARELATGRERDRRRRHGAQERAAYEAPAQARRGRVFELRQRGMTWRTIGAELGVSEAEARRLGKASPSDA